MRNVSRLASCSHFTGTSRKNHEKISMLQVLNVTNTSQYVFYVSNKLRSYLFYNYKEMGVLKTLQFMFINEVSFATRYITHNNTHYDVSHSVFVSTKGNIELSLLYNYFLFQ